MLGNYAMQIILPLSVCQPYERKPFIYGGIFIVLRESADMEQLGTQLESKHSTKFISATLEKRIRKNSSEKASA